MLGPPAPSPFQLPQAALSSLPQATDPVDFGIFPSLGSHWKPTFTFKWRSYFNQTEMCLKINPYISGRGVIFILGNITCLDSIGKCYESAVLRAFRNSAAICSQLGIQVANPCWELASLLFVCAVSKITSCSLKLSSPSCCDNWTLGRELRPWAVTESMSAKGRPPFWISGTCCCQGFLNLRRITLTSAFLWET